MRSRRYDPAPCTSASASIEIDRIVAALARQPERFRERVYTPREVAECERKPRPAQSYAGRFAGKEAMGKVLGRGVPFTWTEIEIAGRRRAARQPHGPMRAAADGSASCGSTCR